MRPRTQPTHFAGEFCGPDEKALGEKVCTYGARARGLHENQETGGSVRTNPWKERPSGNKTLGTGLSNTLFILKTRPENASVCQVDHEVIGSKRLTVIRVWTDRRGLHTL